MALEAMAAKVPVVVADTGGLAEIVVHGVDGLKCYAGHHASLAGQVLAVLNDATLAQKLAENAFRKVMTHFSWQEIACQTRNIYQEVLAESRRKVWIPAEDSRRGGFPFASGEAALGESPVRVH